MDKIDIKNLTFSELKEELRRLPAPSYRAGQIFRWVYKRGNDSVDDMTNMPKELRGKLSQEYYIGRITLKERIKSMDGTEKFLFELSDRTYIESVLIRAGKRKTLCVSSQAGCKYGCVFCASGVKGFKRNLSASEILSQILYLQNTCRQGITNFVFMGMGEPLDNFENVARSIMVMNCPEGLGIGARRITVSTCGIVPAIERLKDMGLQVNLALSLHATTNRLRDALVPVNKRYPLESVIGACKKYTGTGRRVTIEYALIKGRNDSPEDAARLSKIAKRLKAKVNLIPCSHVSGTGCQAPSRREMLAFKLELVRNSINVTLRESKGGDIEAACGQLAMRRLYISNIDSG